MSETKQIRDARWRRLARRYARLITVGTGAVVVGADVAADDAELLEPPEEGQERSYLDRLSRRTSAWMTKWHEAVGKGSAAAEMMRERLAAVVRDAIDRVHHTSGALLDPWQSWMETLETGAAKAFGGGLGSGLGWAFVIGLGLYLVTKKG